MYTTFCCFKTDNDCFASRAKNFPDNFSPPRLSSQTLTDEILREDSESKLCNQQVDDVSVVLGAHQLFHIDRNNDEDDARAEAADDARTNQNFKCASAMKTEQVGN